MAFNDLELHSIKKEVTSFVEVMRPHADIRDVLDIYYRIDGQSIEIGHIRQVWRRDPGEKVEHPAAKITYVRKQNT